MERVMLISTLNFNLAVYFLDENKLNKKNKEKQDKLK